MPNLSPTPVVRPWRRPVAVASARPTVHAPVEWTAVPTTRPASSRLPGDRAATVDALDAAQRDALAELIRLTPLVDRLGVLFADAGHELYLVGGSVRDALLGRLGNDLDFTTSARPDDIEALLRRFSPAVWTIGKEFGTVGCRVTDQASGTDWVVEVTTFRSDAYAADSRKPAVAFGDTVEGDLLRRDFTVNAMAVELPSRRFVDPYGGLRHLARKILMTPAEPEISFGDDPLRMMRAARFAAQLSMVPAPDVVLAMEAMAERISIVSAERVRDELSKLLLADDPRPGLDLLVGTGLADRVLPELPALQLERDEHHRHKDVYEHSLTVLDQAIELEERCPSGPTWSTGWPRCCTTSASRRRVASSPAARCRSTTTTSSAPSWRASG